MLPTPLKLAKKALRILKSSLSPNQIALSFALGLFAGLPPMGLHVLIPCSVALILRVSFRGFLWAVALWKLLSLAVAPGAYAIGKWLLDPARGLDALWRHVFSWPVLAPMDYNRYLLLGSAALALTLVLPATRAAALTEKEARSLIKTHISHLRQKIARHSGEPCPIANVRGVGYMWPESV